MKMATKSDPEASEAEGENIQTPEADLAEVLRLECLNRPPPSFILLPTFEELIHHIEQNSCNLIRRSL